MKKIIIVLTLGFILWGSWPLQATPERVEGSSSAQIIDNREEGANLRIAIYGEPADLLYHLAVKGGTKHYQGKLVIWAYEGWSCFFIEETESHACINDVTVAGPWDGK